MPALELVELHNISTPRSLAPEIWFWGAGRLYRNLRTAKLTCYLRRAKAASSMLEVGWTHSDSRCRGQVAAQPYKAAGPAFH